VSLVSDIQAVSSAAVRSLHGETVVLSDSLAATVATVTDAVASIEPASVGGVGDGPAQHSAVLRLAGTHRASALASVTVTLRGMTWHIVSVGEVYGDSVRVELRRNESGHTNEFTLDEEQALYGA
jgi:hypothetical protein